jgi:hypothetical protein
MYSKTTRYYLTFILLSASLVLLFCDVALSAERFVISMPVEKLIGHLKGGRRIIDYKIEISGGRVYSVMKIPDDWSIKVDYRRVKNIPQFAAYAGHGVSWLTVDDIKNKEGLFEKFLVIETVKGEGKFDIKAYFEIDVPMEDKTEHIVLEKKDMVITALKER